uniref:LON peptidase N-terminal domain and ring finger 2 n=1 Tax=Cyclopterus lumpus TaxID=8103 RepID=A0A8C3AR58_CYCLU
MHYIKHNESIPQPAAGVSPEMLEVAEEATRAGDFNLAAEIYSSQLAELQQPDRGLCLRKADSLTRTGRITEALDSYCAAASLGKLRPEELPVLVDTIARTLREKEPGIPGTSSGDGDCGEDDALDLFSCRLCSCLLHEPTTVECGHTFCRVCLEDDSVRECAHCKQALSKRDGLPNGRRLDVVLSGLLDKLFATESKARKFWIEGEVLWKNRDLPEALEKYNAAVDLAPSSGSLLCQRAELHMEMRSFSQAVQDGSSLCRMKPLWTKAHCVNATALKGAGRPDEALHEYLVCVALKPDWTTAKLEAQKVCVCDGGDGDDSGGDGDDSGGDGDDGGDDDGGDDGDGDDSDDDDDGGGGVDGDDDSDGGGDGDDGDGGGDGGGDGDGDDSGGGGGGDDDDDDDGGGGDDDDDDGVVPSGAESHGRSSSAFGGRTFPAELLDSGDMECSLCMRLFYEPVATPCGHTFCLKCLERCLDHNSNCPLCKENLSEYLATRGYSKTLLMEEVLQRYLGDELAERKKIHEEEMKELSNLNQEVPIFVCTMAFPTITCPLHVFEPRYRLMIRRSMETGTKQFGMCIADELKGFADYGCMLEVRDVKFFPDGRSVVDTIGVSRFKVLSHGQRDGYHTAKIDYLEDKKVEGEGLVELLKLHNAVYEQANNWFTSLKDNMKSQILSHFGHLPSKDSDPQASPSGPAWCWWLLAVLPLENRAQLTILAMTSLKDRLIAIRRVLIFVTRKRSR